MKEYLKRAGADWDVIANLKKRGSLIELAYQGKSFYLRKFPGKSRLLLNPEHPLWIFTAQKLLYPIL